MIYRFVNVLRVAPPKNIDLVVPGISYDCNDALVDYNDPRKRMPGPAISLATAKWPGSVDA